MECEPADSVDIANVAVPLASAAVPIWADPSKNVTDPLGGATNRPVPAETAAVNVTEFEKNTGLDDEPSVTAGEALFTRIVTFALAVA